MQAYEHIWTILAIGAERGQTKEQALKMVREYGAYATLTDSIRSELNPTSDGSLKAYRPLSHYTDGAWMELPYGQKLKNFSGLNDINFHMPANAERKSADGPTDIKSFIEHNKEFLRYKRSAFTLAHLLQDTVTDRIIQKDIATAYYTIDEEQTNEQNVNLYGYDTKGGVCRFNKTNKIVSMGDFRNMVTLFLTLTSSVLWKRIKSQYPDLTIDEVAESAKEAYKRDYNESMLESASKYVRPDSKCEKFMESDILEESVIIADSNVQSIEDIKSRLIEIGSFNNKREIDDIVEQTVRECVEVFNDSKSIVSSDKIQININLSKETERKKGIDKEVEL